MTLEADIIEVLRNSQGAHDAIVTELARARAENEALRRRIADLETSILALEARTDNLVDPSAVRPLMAELAQLLSEGYGVILSRPDAEAPAGSGPAETGLAASPNRSRSSARGWT